MNTEVKHILTHPPFSEITIIGNFIVHLSPSFTDQLGKQAYNFAILNDLEQLVGHPICIPDLLSDTPNILDLFLTSNPLLHLLKI